MRTHRAVVGRRFRSVTKLTTKVRIGRGYLWGSFLIAAASLKTPTRNGYNVQGVNLNFRRVERQTLSSARRAHRALDVGLTLLKPNPPFLQHNLSPDPFSNAPPPPLYAQARGGAHLCIYVCIYVYIYIYVCVCVCVYVFVFVCVYPPSSNTTS